MNSKNSIDNKRFPDLSRVSIAILESIVEPILGKETIKVLKEPVDEKELQTKLKRVLLETESRFLAQYHDKELCETIIVMPVTDFPSVQKAARIFYGNPSDPVLANLLEKMLSNNSPSIPVNRIHSAVLAYLDILRRELISAFPQSTATLSALAIQDINQNTEQMKKGIEEMNLTLKEHKQTRLGSVPPIPSTFIGRDDDLHELKKWLGVDATGKLDKSVQIMTVVKGWPGVGKTTLAAALAHDNDVENAFPDGILWAQLDQKPNLISEIAIWGQALGTDELLRVHSLEDAQTRLAALLKNKRMLLIIDDVWQPEHAIPLMVGGKNCAILITTRLDSVANALASKPASVYRLGTLNDSDALKLLGDLAPTVIRDHPEKCLLLVHELEGLPLAVKVAGHLLNAEASLYGFGVVELLEELRHAKLLEQRAPADRTNLAEETTPTIAALLYKSLDLLDEKTRDCYAYLGAFASQPAKFDIEAMKFVWQIEDAKPIVRILVDRGLLEYVPDENSYWMHALLVKLAESLLA